LLPSAYSDVPWHEPALVAELLRRPWDVRSPLARLTGFLIRRPDPARILAKSIANLHPPEPAGELPARALALAEQGSPGSGSSAHALTSASG
jgi:hypothetical protein